MLDEVALTSLVQVNVAAVAVSGATETPVGAVSDMIGPNVFDSGPSPFRLVAVTTKKWLASLGTVMVHGEVQPKELVLATARGPVVPQYTVHDVGVLPPPG